MASQQLSLPCLQSIFGDYHIDGPDHGNSHEPIPESPFTLSAAIPYPEDGQYRASPPVTELAAFSLRSPKCPQCRGKRFDYTAYFHNPRFFRAPPHALLAPIERSYVLKNRLSSILVTYIVHDLHDDHVMADIKADITDWVELVSKLAGEVGDRAVHAEGVAEALAGVELWTADFARQLRDHLDHLTGQKMEVPRGWKKEVLSEFRKRWESVWICCANACAYHQEMVSPIEQGM
ncbi:hypothetical protein BUE80_DR002665 [Diplocarpon rosae]|nr:hypothetical protein BUE80_DR002665 [Diplocarpon rosae]